MGSRFKLFLVIFIAVITAVGAAAGIFYLNRGGPVQYFNIEKNQPDDGEDELGGGGLGGDGDDGLFDPLHAASLCRNCGCVGGIRYAFGVGSCLFCFNTCVSN